MEYLIEPGDLNLQKLPTIQHTDVAFEDEAGATRKGRTVADILASFGGPT